MWTICKSFTVSIITVALWIWYGVIHVPILMGTIGIIPIRISVNAVECWMHNIIHITSICGIPNDN